MHTPLCNHAIGSPSEYAAQARAVGLKEIGFSEHSPMARDDFDDWRIRLDQLDTYVEMVRQARRDQPDLIIKLALEVDFIPGHEDWIKQLADRHPWDYLIGSVHYISDSWAVDNPKHMSHWKEHEPFEVWSLYFDRLRQAAESGLFDIIGHMDLPKKFAIRPTQDCSPLYRMFLEAARDRNLAVEFNTAGLRKDCREIYPAESAAHLMKEYEVAITFGSDAHAPQEVGHAFPEALDLAKKCGFTSWRRFTSRRSESVPL